MMIKDVTKRILYATIHYLITTVGPKGSCFIFVSNIFEHTVLQIIKLN